MRTYVVQAGDSPAKISALFAGCPKCARDLIPANRHKEAVVYPNGFLSFKELRAGEKLYLPDKWFSKEFEELPPIYFKALPHMDGVTPSTLGDRAAGLLGDFAAVEQANARLGAMPGMNDDEFRDSIDPVADSIDRAVSDLPASKAAGDARAATARARGKKEALRAAMAADNKDAAFEVRNAIIGDLSNGLVAAREALATTDTVPVTTAPLPTTSAINALVTFDPCVPANAARVCAAQTELGVSPDGKYGQNTASTARLAVPDAPPGCSPRPSWWRPAGASNCPGASSSPAPTPQPGTITPPTKPSSGLSTAGIVGLGLLGVSTVGGAIYLTTRPRRKRNKSKARR